MFIRDEIEMLHEAGILIEFVPIFLVRRRRQVFLFKDLACMVEGPWPTKADAFRWGYVRADLEHLIQDAWIVVPENPRRGGVALMSLLVPPEDAVWDIRCRDPQPGIRILGCFALKDVFIGLTWEYRLPLKDFESSEWRDAISGAKRRWNLCFWHQPLKGSYPDEYLSGAILDGDPGPRQPG